jgi:predicted methyltransferase
MTKSLRIGFLPLFAFALSLGSSLASDPARGAEQPRDRARATNRYQDAEYWSKVWDHPSRDEWQEPARIVELMAIEKGMSVADIGAGTGYFNARLSAAVGPQGMVYSVDIETEMVEHMRERAAAEKTSNVKPVLGVADDPRLPVEHVDRILMVDTYHHIDHRVAYFTKLRRHLLPAGLFIDVDWKPGQLELGPPPRHKIAPEDVIAEMTRAGFELLASHELEYQYVLVFRPLPAEDPAP